MSNRDVMQLRKLIAYEIGIWSFKEKIYLSEYKNYLEKIKEYYTDNVQRRNTLITVHECNKESFNLKKEYITDVLEILCGMYFNINLGIKESMPKLNRFYKGDPRDEDYDLDKIDELYKKWLKSGFNA